MESGKKRRRSPNALRARSRTRQESYSYDPSLERRGEEQNASGRERQEANRVIGDPDQGYVTSFYEDRPLNRAYERLRSRDYPADDIDVVMSDDTRRKHFENTEAGSKGSRRAGRRGGRGRGNRCGTRGHLCRGHVGRDTGPRFRRGRTDCRGARWRRSWRGDRRAYRRAGGRRHAGRSVHERTKKASTTAASSLARGRATTCVPPSSRRN